MLHINTRQISDGICDSGNDVEMSPLNQINKFYFSIFNILFK